MIGIGEDRRVCAIDVVPGADGSVVPAGSARTDLRARLLILCVLFLWFIFLLFVGGARGQTASGRRASSAATVGQTFRISGTVVNASTGEIVRGATVSVGRPDGSDALRTMTTGDNGDFRFENLETGKYVLRAQAPGFGEQGFEEHEAFVTAIVTGGAVDSEHLVFRLRPDATITGVIVDEGNEPVRNAQVMLFLRQRVEGVQARGFPSSNAPVNDEGRYRFSHLAPGTYFIAVQATPWYAQNENSNPTLRVVNPSGETGTNDSTTNDAGQMASDRALDVTYPLTFYPGVTEENAATPLVLRPGDRVTADVRLSPVQALHVRVRTPARNESEPVNAMLMRKIFGGLEMPVQSQNMQTQIGEIEVSGVAPGDYEVRVETYGKTPERWTQGLALGSDAEVSVNERSPSATVKGIVKMDGGASLVQRGFVRLSNRATGDQASAEVSDKGEFDLSQQQITPGSYEVTAGDLQNGRVSGISATGAKVVGQNIEISGTGAVQLTITLRHGLGTVEGTVMREGKPASGAMVVLVPQDVQNNLPLVRRDQSDLDGTFTLGAVLPGKYTVVAIQDGWDLDWMDMRVLDPFLKNGEKLDVGANGKYAVKVAVQ